jgi:hypothetical protein
MVVVVKRAQRLMHPDAKPESLCDPLDGEVAELL